MMEICNKAERVLNILVNNYPSIVKEMKNCEHSSDNTLNPYHMEGDVWTHTMMVFNEALNTNDICIIIAALLHDIGKPYVKKYDEVKKKTYFNNHSNASVFISIDILKDMVAAGIINDAQMIAVIELISFHDIFFTDKKYTVDELARKFYVMGSYYYNRLIQLVNCDIMGRINIRSDNSTSNNISLYLSDSFITEVSDEIDKLKNNYYNHHVMGALYDKPFIEYYIGIPYSGKSTHIQNKYSNNKDVIILSRDTIITDMYPDDDYNSAFKKADQKEVDRILNDKFNNAIKNNKNIVIDMTNTSKKSRKRFTIPNNKKYCKRATVLLLGMKELSNRRIKRTDKEIDSKIISRFVESLTIPLYDEMDIVNIIAN